MLGLREAPLPAAKVHFCVFCSFFLVESSPRLRGGLQEGGILPSVADDANFVPLLTGPHSELQPGECLCGAYIRAIMVPLFRAFCCLAWTPIHYSNPEAYSDNNRGLQSTQVLALKPHRAFEVGGSHLQPWRPRLDEMSVSPEASPHSWPVHRAGSLQVQAGFLLYRTGSGSVDVVVPNWITHKFSLPPTFSKLPGSH